MSSERQQAKAISEALTKALKDVPVVVSSKRPTQLMSVAAAAEVLDCSRGHVINLIAKKHLRAVDIGIGRSKTRIYPEDLQAYIASHTR